MLIAGIGRGGIVTVGAVLAMAAHLERGSASVLDMSGFAQRNGSVMSHVRFTPRPQDEPHSRLIPSTRADLVIGCDAIVAAGPEVVAMLAPDKGHAVL